MPNPRHHIAVEPSSWRSPALIQAVEAGGGTVVPLAEAAALVFSDPQAGDRLGEFIHDDLTWVQLPYAGIENMVTQLDDKRTWTCGKGVYARPVAEHALTAMLAGLRNFVGYARASSWSGPVGRNLDGANVVILGGGGITEELLKLLEPFRTRNVVVRRTPQPMAGAHEVLATAELMDALPAADIVVLALALTPETRGIIGAAQLDALADHAWLINVARGAHIDTDSLVTALTGQSIGGAVLDVTEPEPLPADHPLWAIDNCLITPHIGNTPEMGLVLLAERVTENVRRFIEGDDVIGTVDTALGY